MAKPHKQNPQNSEATGPVASEPSVAPVEQASPDTSESVTEPQPEAVEEVKLVDIPDVAPVQTAVIEDAPDEVVASHGLSDEQFFKLHSEASAVNDKEDFRQRILEARMAPPPIDPGSIPASPRMIEQTNAELDAGRALVAKNEALKAERSGILPVRDRGEGTSTEVFRPATHVPDPKKPVPTGHTVLRG